MKDSLGLPRKIDSRWEIINEGNKKMTRNKIGKGSLIMIKDNW